MNENQQENRKPYTRETWPGYKLFRTPFNGVAKRVETVSQHGIETAASVWPWSDLVEWSAEGSHDGVTWYPCYQGGEASAIGDCTPSFRAESTVKRGTAVSIDSGAVTSDGVRIGGVVDKTSERVPTPDDAVAEVEKLRAENARLQSELAAVKSECQKRDNVIGLQTELFMQQNRELAAERRWQERLRELFDGNDDALDIRYGRDGVWYIVKLGGKDESDTILGHGTTPAAAVEAAAKALG